MPTVIHTQSGFGDRRGWRLGLAVRGLNRLELRAHVIPAMKWSRSSPV